MPRSSSEFRESPSLDYSLSWMGDAAELIHNLAAEEAVNILVSQGGKIVLSMESHSVIKKRRGLEDDQVLLEGLAENHNGHIHIFSDFHGASKMAQQEIPEIEDKLNDEILPLIRAA